MTHCTWKYVHYFQISFYIGFYHNSTDKITDSVWFQYLSVQFSSAAHSCPILCVPWTSMPCFPVNHQLPELAQTHVHQVVMPSNHLILCRPLLLPSNFPIIRVSSNESVLRINWPKYWSSSFSISPSSDIQDWFPLGLTGLTSLQSKGLSRVFSNTTVQKHQFFGTQLALWFNSHIHTWLLEKPQGPLLAK